jgi:hypothetical protein
VLDEIRRLAAERSVFRGQVISFGPELLGPVRMATPLSFLERPAVTRDQIVLPAELLDDIERQMLGVARHSARLLASRQHLKRGILLHGEPGTGKTHTVSYLLGQMPDEQARRALLRLYQGDLVLDEAPLDSVIARTDGVTAAFLKELLRKAAVLSAESEPGDGPIRVTGAHLTAALDKLLDGRSQLTRALLGAQSPPGEPEPAHPEPAR